jgi:hypothetical protein
MFRSIHLSGIPGNSAGALHLLSSISKLPDLEEILTAISKKSKKF